MNIVKIHSHPHRLVMPVSEAIRNQIVALKTHTSKSDREIATDIGVHHSTVANIWKKWTSTGSTEPYSGAHMGPTEKLTRREKAVIVREAKRDPKATSREIQAGAGGVGSKVSTITVRRVLLASGLRCYRPVKKPLLTRKHKSARLQWARAHRHWTVDEWKKVGLVCFTSSHFNNLFFDFNKICNFYDFVKLDFSLIRLSSPMRHRVC